MKILGLDTSNKFLVITLIEDDKVVYHIRLEVYRNASEITNHQIDLAFKEVGWRAKDLDAVVTTRGPGSFTGIRIGMSIAKVICTTFDIPLYSISSLNYYAGLEDTAVILDARSNKAYFGEYNEGKTLNEAMLTIEEIKAKTINNIIGELKVLDKEDKFLDLRDNFLLLKDFWREESYLDAKPDYYKSNI